MLIDLHCHTKKMKTGESESRNISKDSFIEKITMKKVKVVAITNHNSFDIDQYRDFSNNEYCAIWPGVELDVKGNKSNGHCIIIANPNDVEIFSNIINQITVGVTPDNFSIEINKLCAAFSNINVVVIAHYGGKKPALCNDDILLLKESLNNRLPLYIEVSNLRSAGIMIAHGENTLIGSDIRDWKKYQDCDLPELKLEINDYEKFLLLVKKDSEIIKTFMDKKESEIINIRPFQDCELNLKIYNDINVIFGGKGTGKTEILKALQKHYEAKGNSDVTSYYAADNKLKYTDIIKEEILDTDFDTLGIATLKGDFDVLKNWKEASITTIDLYKKWIETKNNDLYKKNFGFVDAVDLEILDEQNYRNEQIIYAKIKKNLEELQSIRIDNYLSIDDTCNLSELHNKLLVSSQEKVIDEFSKYHASLLRQFTINKMKIIYQKKQGVVSKPSKTGFISVFENCKKINSSSARIFEALDSEEKTVYTPLGRLGDKGTIFLAKSITINPSLEKYKKRKITKSDAEKIKTLIKKIEKNSYSNNFKSDLAILSNLLFQLGISDLKSFISIKCVTCKESKEEYNPSNGEQSMLLLNYSLLNDSKQVYILDEPEMSVGHKFINEVIVPKLRDLSKLNKTIIISTHDANIAVRTLPMQCIYREDLGLGVYKTFIGNPFIDNMKNTLNENDILSWSMKCLETLEGGENAFYERGETYGE